MRKLIYLALAMLATHMSAQTSITSCESNFTDIGGQSSQYINSESSEWLVCPETADKYLSIEFTYVDIETADDAGVNGTGCRDMIHIYDGMDDSAPLVGNYCGQESTDGDTSYVSTNTLEVGMSFTPNNIDGCFFIKFESDAINTRNGWNAIVECCDPTLPSHISDGVNCPEVINDGTIFDFEVDLSCTRKGNIGNFTNYVYNEYTPDCMIAAEEKPNKAYYIFDANSVGSFTLVDVDPIDDLGEISIFAIGPLYGNCPEYTGGFIVDCQVGEDPGQLLFNMSANSTFMIVVATDSVGSFRMYSDPASTSLPVEMIHYDVTKENDAAVIEWTTTQEVNNAGFEIYRAQGNNDFELISEITPQGNYDTAKDYSYVDRDVRASGEVFYFIRQIDLDGNYNDYDVKSITFENKEMISVYPNPASNRLNIVSGNNENGKVTMYNSIGSIAYQTQTSFPMDLDVTGIPTGVYTIVIESESEVKTLRQVFSD